MDELIQQLIKQLGLDPKVASGAVDKVAALVKEHAGEDLFNQIASYVPGFDNAATVGAQSLTADPGSSSLLGSLTKIAASALGGSGGKTMEITRQLIEAGVPTEKLGELLKMIVEFLKAKAGPEVVAQMLSRFPILKQLLA